MGDSRVSSQRLGTLPPPSLAGIVTKIRVENFMCHSNLQIELGDCVNFITGQNGSGKSAILTALCVAFGCRAKGTQRASTLKDFIKTGCSYANVQVELKNEGGEAFKPEVYGDVIIIERRISESTSSTVLKDHQGRKVATRREELHEIVEHFNIDVENPCVIMSQDKSREFLHSGNDKEKFKFFFKATLLQQVYDLLQSITAQLNDAHAQVDELESSIRPILKELSGLQDKIKNMEHVEEISQNLQQLKKKLAWSWVYDVDKQIGEQAARIEMLKERIPACQLKIDGQKGTVEELKGRLTKKKAQIASMMERTSEVRKQKDELQQHLSMATKERLELVEEHSRKKNQIQKMIKRIQLLEKQIAEIQEQHMNDTQAEEFQMEELLKILQDDVNTAYLCLTKLKEDETGLYEQLSIASKTIENIGTEIEETEQKCRNITSQIRKLRQHQTDEVTAFGGDKVLNLLKAIERNYKKFTMPPIGPIGSHVKLRNEMWGAAAEIALGKLLNAFIVTNHKDSLLLRACAREARYSNLQIIIYEFGRPKLNIPPQMLPQTQHPTTHSQIFSDNSTVSNVLVDVAHAERQVLVKDYEVGKSVAFDQRIANLKEVFTSEGHKMFFRNSVETILPPNKWMRTGRLARSFDGQIKKLENDGSQLQELARQGRGRKRDAEEAIQDLQARYSSVKKRRECAEKDLISKQLELRDVKNSQSAEAKSSPASNVDELCQEISKLQDEMHENERLLEKYQAVVTEAEARAKDLKLSFEKLCESTKHDIDAFEEAERELMVIEDAFAEAEKGKSHYERVMQTKVLPDIEKAEAHYQELQVNRQESCKKASVICSESELEALGGCLGNTPEQLSAQIKTLDQKLQQESRRYVDSIDDLRALYEKKQRKVSRKQKNYESFREKLKVCEKALDLRWRKFHRNASFLKRQLTWQFNGHLRKKGISGSTNVNYEKSTLSVEVKMPQDASSNIVRDTRGLSGGERSFSTLCFALALHEMTEAPFRAMDEFDVFMDAVSRKISLDTLVDFALGQGSQWILITPHDISMVKPHERVKKQQMAAPRG
ncbi:hypothetical protein AQUCO_03500177v1 [Aquilegia coerulea]|uniref:RecF/RecN/SMC N-terminal domain-containing protein n=1 Tax=Aquilegia coerulea TaxID=218851 RepID=A0A2G5CWJ2_AQUCA|nr:hypothetical protein AQUCO_03500177v1 [Aquilegia coerulea]